MTAQRIFRASDPADLLALVPGLLGFHPEESVVVMTVGDGDRPLHARVDLPGDPVGVDFLVHYLAALAARSDLRRFVVVVYSHDAGLAEALVRPFDVLLSGIGAELVCAVRAAGDRWWLVGAPSDDPGTEYDVRSHPFMAQMVLDGTVVLGSRRELADSLVGDDPEDLAAVEAALASLAPRLRPGMVPAVGHPAFRHRLVPEGHWVRHRVRRWLTDRERLDPHDTARLAVATAASIEVRDVAWAEIRRENAGPHVDLWRDVVRRVPPEVRYAPATLLGFAGWLSGNGALAWCAVDVARECSPDYSLAGLLADVLTQGMPPSSWRPLPPEALTLFAG
jgi:Domain of unknown function (DUF4192)